MPRGAAPGVGKRCEHLHPHWINVEGSHFPAPGGGGLQPPTEKLRGDCSCEKSEMFHYKKPGKQSRKSRVVASIQHLWQSGQKTFSSSSHRWVEWERDHE